MNSNQLKMTMEEVYIPKIIYNYYLTNFYLCFISANSDEFGMVRTVEEQFMRDIGYKRHAFNTLVSHKIGLIRDLPDTRNHL